MVLFSIDNFKRIVYLYSDKVYESIFLSYSLDQHLMTEIKPIAFKNV